MGAKGARRRLSGALHRHARRALPAACLWLAVLAPGPAGAEIVAARYDDPTTRYDHGVLGDAIEHGALVMKLADGRSLRLVLPEDRVFEDTEPRLADLDGDGAPEVIVVETSQTRGARLSVYGEDGLIAATPHIGRRYRWLAPIGAADLDGDGRVEIAYIDRPHLAKLLRVWRFVDGKLVHVADMPGLTNHRIGEADIAGGIRDCGQGSEMIVATADWSQVMAATLSDGKVTARPVGPHKGRESFAAALDCED